MELFAEKRSHRHIKNGRMDGSTTEENQALHRKYSQTWPYQILRSSHSPSNPILESISSPSVFG